MAPGPGQGRLSLQEQQDVEPASFIEYVIRMESCFDRVVFPNLTKESMESPPPIDPREQPFTPRQLEILDLLLAGRRVKEMAFLLELSSRTIEHHLERICQKAGVGSTRELLIWVFRRAA